MLELDVAEHKARIQEEERGQGRTSPICQLTRKSRDFVSPFQSIGLPAISVVQTTGPKLNLLFLQHIHKE
jgi:hypothetical protein